MVHICYTGTLERALWLYDPFVNGYHIPMSYMVESWDALVGGAQ